MHHRELRMDDLDRSAAGDLMNRFLTDQKGTLQEELFAFIEAHPGCTVVGEIFDAFGTRTEVSSAVAGLVVRMFVVREPGTGKLTVDEFARELLNARMKKGAMA